MDGILHHDPFLWGVDDVAEELSRLRRPCTRDPAALKEAVREQEIDGNALLTFEFVCSRHELFECLGIKIGGHKAALGLAIHRLRSQSPAFQKWKREFTRRENEDQDLEDNASVPNEDSLLATTPAAIKDDGTPSGSSAPFGGPGSVTNLKRKADALDDRAPFTAASPSPSRANKNMTSSTEPKTTEPDGKKAPKQTRLAPTLLASVPVNLAPLPIATEADFVGPRANARESEANSSEYPWETFSPGAYLGQSSMPVSAIKSSHRAVTSQLHSVDERNFTTDFPIVLPPGVRVVAAQMMKRLLVRNGRTEALFNQGLFLTRPQTPSEDDESVVDLLDLPESLDEETLREIEAEEAEAEAAKVNSRHLDRGVVETILREAMDVFKQRWNEAKLPRYARRAHQIWITSRMKGTWHGDVIGARQRAQAFEDRIKKLCAEILDQSWTKKSDVRLQATCLEQTLADRLYCQWLADTLDSRIEPQKFATREASGRQVRQVDPPQSPLGSEVLTSSDEDDFVVPDGADEFMDERKVPVSDDAVPYAEPQTPAKAVTPTLFVDLTQLETPEKSPSRARAASVVDLTTPAEPKFQREFASSPITSHPSPTASESEFDVEEIGKQNPNFWSKENDRRKLVICLLWKLGHGRRSLIFEAVRRYSCHEFVALILAPVLPLTSNDDMEVTSPKRLRTDTPEETRRFDAVRLFLSYMNVKHCKESRVSELFRHKQDRALLVKQVLSSEERPDQKDSEIATFHAFLGRIELLFPQESQIVRLDYSDDDMGVLTDGADDLLASPDTPTRPRRKVPKELVQNKEGVDMRLREKRRVEEQEARRRKLRAALGSTDMPSNKTRLIINEAKQDHEAFLYINDETAKRIKDHQIEGVRFMWNQIILQDDNQRQGCLLAHTMGLGKTMQVITFLVAVQEAARSSDPSAREQVPKDLRESKTLVLCPAGLVDNWIDELLQWTSGEVLGPIRHVAAMVGPGERHEIVAAWAQSGGVLVVGYSMLQRLIVANETTKAKLLESPNIVVADEAHYLKNKDIKLHQTCERFKTKCRIALTGTPLANNVEEYYSMVNWIAPNYLSTLDEFRQRFANAIHDGLWGDSLGWQKRLALKRLQELKETVAPKIHRATIQSLKKDLPPKKEFVLCIPPTKLQTKLYDVYVTEVLKGEISSATVFKIVNDLMLLCNHPRCLMQKAMNQKHGGVEEHDKISAEDHRKSEKESKLPASVVTATLKEMHAHTDKDAVGLSMKAELLCVILDEAKRVQDKVLVFSQSLATLNYLMYILRLQKRRVSRLDGSTNIAKRQEMVKAFNTGDQEVYLVSTTAGGVGLNIHGANRVVIFDYKWNPVQEQQAIGRAFRIGQTKEVFVYRFMVAGSYEEDLQNKAVFKTQLASRVVDKKNPVSWSNRLGSLVHPLRRVPPRDLTDFIGKDAILDKLISYTSNRERAPIRFIVSTDTFEEEDPTNNLTAEELREVDQMVKMNRLRVTDPKEYERLQEEQRRLEIHRALPVHYMHRDGPAQLVSAPPTAALSQPAQAVQTTYGAQDGHGKNEGRVEAGASNTTTTNTETTIQPGAHSLPQTAALQPLPGTNTYFGDASSTAQSIASRPSHAPEVQSTPRTPVMTPGNLRAIFSPPKQSRDRAAFEQTLRKALEELQKAQFPGVGGEPRGAVKKAAEGINRYLKADGLGFLKEDQRWRLLDNLVQSHHRFALAVVSGCFSLQYVALAAAEELQRRLDGLNGLSEGDLKAQLAAELAADPRVRLARGRYVARKLLTRRSKNLQNLQRSDSVSGAQLQSPRAREDLEVMREAAARRQQWQQGVQYRRSGV
ncbi:hypothetical protein JDV02_000836 [Purpureocillium takamizusanense]|uniref:Uncharacterized protein n=1 Tax=Purpureocillium takamizusanense TaxID=2060973 RepID=A0A9Q8V6T7_9HYPO|nr:uncharacterized protein JDV02_000836 [Purpureocillium takamizusanense]UNI14179.1 hypothetical protein JDV02_000836 [Purpureocillium takamizusanense]